jgi:hypothetical protein
MFALHLFSIGRSGLLLLFPSFLLLSCIFYEFASKRKAIWSHFSPFFFFFENSMKIFMFHSDLFIIYEINLCLRMCDDSRGSCPRSLPRDIITARWRSEKDALRINFKLIFCNFFICILHFYLYFEMLHS